MESKMTWHVIVLHPTQIACSWPPNIWCVACQDELVTAKILLSNFQFCRNYLRSRCPWLKALDPRMFWWKSSISRNISWKSRDPLSAPGGRTVTMFSEAYRLQKRCDCHPCVWTSHSHDTLLISIWEAATEYSVFLKGVAAGRTHWCLCFDIFNFTELWHFSIYCIPQPESTQFKMWSLDGWP